MEIGLGRLLALRVSTIWWLCVGFADDLSSAQSQDVIASMVFDHHLE